METLNETRLVEAHRDIEVPFKLRLRRDGTEFEPVFRRVLRLLPGKRIVAVADCDGEEVLLKTYLGRTAVRYAARERCGVQAISSAGVQTPGLLWSAHLADGQGEVLAFRYLRDADSLYQRWEEADSDRQRLEILDRIMDVIGKLHNHGCAQDDLHLANFLLAAGGLYTIDGGEVNKRSREPLAESLSLKNLGLFFCQLYPRYDHLVANALPKYEQVRGWDSQPNRLAVLEREIADCREARKRNYIDKTFRDCTRFVCKSSFSRFQVCERRACTEEMKALLKDPDSAIEAGQVLKDGNSSTVALVHLSDRSLVIKRYNIKSPWHALRRAFRKSRAWTSWSNAHRMEFLGIPALKPIAMIESRIGPLRTRAWFITEYIEGPNALTCLRNMTNPNGELEKLASILHELSEAQISHGDLKATNFLMSEHGPTIIDLDAMREHRSRESFEKAFDRDLERFMENWKDRPDLERRFDGLLGHLHR